jgi:monomeric sarcosine oxidase
MTTCASNRGAVIQDNEAVKQITATSDGVEILTDKNKYKASKLIISAGAWTNKLLKFFNLELPLQPSQEQTVYFRPIANKEQFNQQNFPIWINYRENVVYGMPSFTEPAIKIGFHHNGYYLDVDDYKCEPKEEVTNRLRDYVNKYIPNAAGEAFGVTPCLYTNTPDHDFVVDVLANHPNVAIAAGFSGHGFKFSIGIGRALADLVLQGSTEMKIQHLKIDRFL